MAGTHPWFGIDEYPQDVALARMRQLVIDSLLRPEPDTRVSGFKEIRWWMAQPVEYLDFIDQAFPGCRYILNTRNHEDVTQSSWYRKNPKAGEDLVKIEERLKDTVGRRGDRGYHVTTTTTSRTAPWCRGCSSGWASPTTPTVWSRCSVPGIRRRG